MNKNYILLQRHRYAHFVKILRASSFNLWYLQFASAPSGKADLLSISSIHSASCEK